MARQFSEGASSAAGGDLGWVQVAQLDPQMAEAVEHMQIGEISAPIRTVSGFHVMWLRERRVRDAPNPNDVQVALRRILVPLPASTPAGDAEAKKNQVQQAAETIKSCDDVGRVAGELGANGNTDLGTLRIADLAPNLQEIVNALPVGKASPALAVDSGLVVMVVCQRTDPTAVALPSRDDIAQRILGEKLDGESRKYLRDLRQAAYIDVRA